MPLLLLSAILRFTGGDGLHSSESIRLRNVPFFFSLLPRSWLGGLAFAVLACFPPGWNGGFHLWRSSGESLGHLLRPVDSPRFKCLGYRVTWSPGLLLYRAVASVTFRLRAAPAVAPVSSHPSPAWFSSKTSASWV